MSIRLAYLFATTCALVALVVSTLEYRGRSRLPVAALVSDRFGWSSRLWPLAGLAVVAGVATVMTPVLLLAWAGAVRVRPAGSVGGVALGLFAASVIVKVLLAATEELVFRGALLEQIARRSAPTTGVLASAALFALAHLGRAEVPGAFALAIYLLDGIAFGVLWLATGTLWIPTLWHAAKNLAVWLVYSRSTLQFTDGLARIDYVETGLWIGGPGQAGLLDLAVTFAVVAAAVMLVTRPRAGG